MAVEGLSFYIVDAHLKHNHAGAKPLRLALNAADECGSYTLPSGFRIHDHALQLKLTATAFEDSTHSNSLACETCHEKVSARLSQAFRCDWASVLTWIEPSCREV